MLRFKHCLLLSACLFLLLIDSSTNQGADPPGAMPLPHGASVSSCAFSPEGKTLATGCGDKMVRIWDLATGKEISRLEAHNGPVVRVAFSPDGKSIVAASQTAATSSMVRMCDATTGKMIWATQTATGQFHGLIFSADGRMLATMGEKRAALLEAATGKITRTFLTTKVGGQAIALSPDSQHLVLQAKNLTVNVWDTNTGQQTKQLANPGGDITALAYSPDGKTIAVGIDKNIRLWDAATLKELRTIPAHQDRVRSLVFLPDSKGLLSGSADRSVCQWDATTGKELVRVLRHRGPVTSVALSRDGKFIASASEDGSVLVTTLAGLKDSKLEPIDLTAKQLDQLWSDLAQPDARGVQAVWTMVAGGKHATPFLQERLKVTAPTIVPEKITQMIKDLDADEFGVREKATLDLEALGKAAEEALRRELKVTTSAEVRRRIERILEKLGPQPTRTPEQVRTERAVGVLEMIGSPEAKDVLGVLAKGDAGADLTKLAKDALERLAKRTGTP